MSAIKEGDILAITDRVTKELENTCLLLRQVKGHTEAEITRVAEYTNVHTQCESASERVALLEKELQFALNEQKQVKMQLDQLQRPASLDSEWFPHFDDCIKTHIDQMEYEAAMIFDTLCGPYDVEVPWKYDLSTAPNSTSEVNMPSHPLYHGTIQSLNSYVDRHFAPK